MMIVQIVRKIIAAVDAQAAAQAARIAELSKQNAALLESVKQLKGQVETSELVKEATIAELMARVEQEAKLATELTQILESLANPDLGGDAAIQAISPNPLVLPSANVGTINPTEVGVLDSALAVIDSLVPGAAANETAPAVTPVPEPALELTAQPEQPTEVPELTEVLEVAIETEPGLVPEPEGVVETVGPEVSPEVSSLASVQEPTEPLPEFSAEPID